MAIRLHQLPCRNAYAGGCCRAGVRVGAVYIADLLVLFSGKELWAELCPMKGFFFSSLQKKVQVTISIKSKWMNEGLDMKVYFGWCYLTEGMHPPVFTKEEWNRQVPHSGLGSTNRSCGSCWCHSYFALCKLKPSKQELKCGSSKWPQQKNQRDNHRTFCWWHVCNSSR